MHDAESYGKVQGSSLYLTVSDDQYFSKENQDAIVAAGGSVRVFEGLHHGFVVRGDFKNDAKQKTASESAMSDAVALFSKACLRKPKMSKVGALQPYSSGVNCLVKIVGEPKSVSEAR